MRPFEFWIGMRQYWAHRRWANPSDPSDLSAVAFKLAHIQRIYEPVRQCSLERIVEVISRLYTSTHSSTYSESDSDSDSAPSSSRPDEAPLLPPLAGLTSLQRTPESNLGRAPHLPPLHSMPSDAVRSPCPVRSCRASSHSPSGQHPSRLQPRQRAKNRRIVSAMP